MRTFWLLLLPLTACIDEIDPRWTLDHDHVIVARATPPRVVEGGSTTLDALVAHEGRSPAVESPMTAELANPPMELSRALSHEPTGQWRLDIPDAQMLASARPALGLPADAPIPVDIVMTFAHTSLDRAKHEPFKVKKTVFVGEPAVNPTAPAILVDGVEVVDEVVVPRDRDVYIEVAELAPSQRVNWLTNVGTLFQDDVPRAFVRVAKDDQQSGELVLVIRDDATAGVAWRILPMRVE
jgi:hypothetical protein